jgi:hypothetical protein
VKFVLFVEGHTEKKALPEFVRRWLDRELDTRVGIQIVRFEGWPEMWRETPRMAEKYLNEPARKDEIIAVIALLDLYGPTIYPGDEQLQRWGAQLGEATAESRANCIGPIAESVASMRYEWAKREQERKVNHPKFRQFFAVHETEAWLLSKRGIFANEVKRRLPTKRPEQVNFAEPPAAALDRIYRAGLGRPYKKVTDGQQLFQRLDPSAACDKCPCLRALLDEMLTLARSVGL